jgi:hypothetical protein
MRRAVDIRDQVEKLDLMSRPGLLVDVLNQLCEVLNIDGNRPLESTQLAF